MHDPSTSPPASSQRWPRLLGLTLMRHLGSGATGAVYAARRDLDGWRCAVKVAHSADPGSVELDQEATVLSNLRLPHLIGLHEVTRTSCGRTALVLDLVDGGSVGEIVAQRGRLQAGEVVTVLAPVLSTLGQLHRVGVVHADVSAANILLTRAGQPMLADLGRSRLVGQHHASIAATMEYLAPEVTASAPPTAAADVYAVGALGWRMLTGQAVPPGLVRRPLSEVVAELPPELATVIDECLRGDPTLRPTAEAAAAAVLAACRASPLPMPEGPDPAEQLTRRLREGWGMAASRGTVATAVDIPGPDVGVSGAGLDVAPGTDSDPCGGRHRRSRAPGQGGHARRGRRVAILCGAAGLVAFALTSGGVQWAASSVGAGGVPTEQPVVVPTPSPAPSTTGSASTARRMPPAVASSPARPPQSGELLATRIATLVDARAAALRSADPAPLASAYLPGSSALAAARAEVAALRRAGVRYDGLRYLLSPPQIERIDPRSCLVRLRIGTSAYVVRRGSHGARADPRLRDQDVVPAQAPTPVRLLLARPDGAGDNPWVIAKVEPG
ncbi:MAG: serine/threonine protein kinase [Austwickia sp.]|nr:serine/threonine protein kinase [Austwickia sp.]MBK8435477.1 serine/threonine protein kinase [Austwickia sp.]MBK9100975.1 serine/threonine protein kinase [Austwickia sp.]